MKKHVNAELDKNNGKIEYSGAIHTVTSPSEKQYEVSFCDMPSKKDTNQK